MSNFLNGFSTQHDHFEGIKEFLDIKRIFGPYQIRLQAYMVPIVTDIAGSDKMYGWVVALRVQDK